MWYPIVKRYYDNQHTLYDNQSLKTFVVAKMITAEEYQQITGIEYVA
ncbi:XkdX family protein [Paenibacillus campinasensis]|uniref:XkdX family protein n=1 Tax=Paenibacillus campinasensis TaxID=66347 RepID=A0ABW9T934_9BACL|nr:XkdX family protein [Paenibacillus campinasensis]MUG68630.1 XkdX family protein [Paenibacillus campinasensis]